MMNLRPRKNASVLLLTVVAIVSVYLVQISMWEGKGRSVSPSSSKSLSDDMLENAHGHPLFALTRNESDKIFKDTYQATLPCKRDQIIKGRWVPDLMKRPPYVTPTVHLRCYPAEFFKKNEPWETWKWLPYDADEASDKPCKLAEWSSSGFCDLMQGATVSIVGDSLSWEHYSSLVQLNGLQTRQGYQHQSRELHMNIAQSVCNGHTRIVYRRDDKLLNLTDSIESTFPTVLVLNRGAHYVNDTELLAHIRHNLEEVGKWLKTCHDTYQMKCHFFWRTSVPGHPDCGNFTKPVNNIKLMESRVADLSFYNERSIKFHWYDYQHQNELVLKELEKSGLQYRVIDGYYLNMLRPDEHRAHQNDCLHNCYPGKMDVYTQLMFHYLRMDRERQDIKQSQSVAKKYKWRLDETTFYDRDATERAKKIRTSKEHPRI